MDLVTRKESSADESVGLEQKEVLYEEKSADGLESIKTRCNASTKTGNSAQMTCKKLTKKQLKAQQHKRDKVIMHFTALALAFIHVAKTIIFLFSSFR